MTSVLPPSSNAYQKQPTINQPCMRTETHRLSTFNDWPCTFIKPAHLAKAGFYYTKREDIVKCAYCGVEIGQWELDDDIASDHKKWSPNCIFLRNHTMPSNNAELSSSNNDGEDTCGKYGIEIKPNSIAEDETRNNTAVMRANLNGLVIPQSKGPTYPNYAIYENRLLSFAEWPRSMKQKPADLADAGFFYTGKGDQTLCFHCGGGLKDWEEDDVPWEQHAIWFPKCNYLLLKKSREYVDQINNRKRSEEPTTSSSLPSTSTQSTLSATTTVETIRKSEPEETAAKSTQPSSEAVSETNTKDSDDDNSNSSNGSNTLCKICYSKEVGVVFLPCGHVVACVDCAPALSQCAVCRKPLEATFRAFLS